MRWQHGFPGLLAEPSRLPSGYRQYAPDAVERVKFLRRAQWLSFTLRDAKELLGLRDDPGADRATAKLADIDTRIAELQAIRAELGRLVAACRGRGPAAGCPIITAIGEETGRRADRPKIAGRSGRRA